MATTNKIYQVTTATTAAAIITPAVGEQFTMSQLLVHNPTAALETFIIYINTVQVYEQAIPAKNSFTIQGPWLFENGDSVDCEATVDELTFTAFGILNN